MDNREPLPLLSATTYASFQRLPGWDLPGTYAGWQAKHISMKTERGKAGHTVIEVPVDRDKFVHFCDERRLPYIGNSLLKFAIETAFSGNSAA